MNLSFLNKKKVLVTHDGSFHSDDLFAIATLSILLDENIEIIRNRDSQIIAKADYVVDVGGQYNGINFFDHHQKGGAGIRQEGEYKYGVGIPFASFGLVWKAYGEKICGNKEVAELIDKKIVCPIDAIDNGVDIAKPIFKDIYPFGADQVFLNHLPAWNETNEEINSIFKNQVREVAKFLRREIEVIKADIIGKNLILKDYDNSNDKKIIILEKAFPRYLYQKTLSGLIEPIYVVMPSGHTNRWKAEAITKDSDTLESRKLFPESWRGLSNDNSELKEITGVSDAVFCHKNGFLVMADSKEGALQLAEKALNS